MERIFVSSLARGDMGAIRQAARSAVESLDMRPVMFETEPAVGESSRRALLDRVGESDALLLLVGEQYGEPGQRGMSPTEEEFDEARRRGIEVLVLVQNTSAREPAQTEFLNRVRGTWEAGILTGTFDGAQDVLPAAVRTLNSWRRRSSENAAAPAIAERTLALARNDDRNQYGHAGGARLRVVVLPTSGRTLIDAVRLRDSALGDQLAGAARASGLVAHQFGVQVQAGADAFELEITGDRQFTGRTIIVGFDGAVVAEGDVEGSGPMAGSLIMADRVAQVIAQSVAFCEAMWRIADQRDEVRQASVAVAVPDAASKVYAIAPSSSSSMSMGSMGRSSVIIAPEPPLIVSRSDLGSPATAERLEAELRRRFQLQDAIHPPPDRASGGFW